MRALHRLPDGGARERRGLAIVAVLLVLMALFVLSAPFLLTVRNVDQASSESSDRANLRLTLDAAARHAQGKLASSHPGLDRTPYFDDLDELSVNSRFPKGFLPTDDPTQVMWDVAAEDVAGRIDLASASPHVLANLIGGAARLTGPCKNTDTELELSGSDGFLEQGVVYVDDELVSYAERGPTRLGKLTRGLLVKNGPDDKPVTCGPSAAAGHDMGAFVLDQRAWAVCEWRIAPGKLRAFDGLEQVRDVKDFVLAPEFGREAYLALERSASPFGHVRAGEVWQRPARVVGDVTGEPQYGCKLPVDDLRWFNPGTTVCITDGKDTEYALVRRTDGNALVLGEPLRHQYKPYAAVVAPLARTPVNVNTARPEVLRALWTNLKLRGKSARITAAEAGDLVDLALVSRPFTGFEDFLRRFVLPAGGLEELPKDAQVRPEKLEQMGRDSKLDANGKKTLVGIVDAADAVALYKCALNANDNELEFATMPLCFTSRDVYDVDLRAAVNAPSGVERAHGVRELSLMVVPQEDLLALWTRQEDFDLAPRLDQAAAGWLTGPTPTSRYDALYGEVTSVRWPTRARANLGPHDSAPSVDPLGEKDAVYCFPVRKDEDGWAQLAPMREDDRARKASYALHFDDESKVLEGRFLPDGLAPLDLAKLGWGASGGLMSGMAFSMWVQPRQIEEGARLLDVGGAIQDTDRLSLLFEGGDLVLRVLDGSGDHPSSSFKEQAEVRHALAGNGPGMPRETWTHVEIAVDGTRPDQLAMWVDGRRAKRTPGLTRLTGGVSAESDTLLVESTEGFPDKCVVRIGDELIEVIKQGAKKFQSKFQSKGENAGFGGRLAREYFQGAEPEMNGGLYKSLEHPAGSSVQLYGYALPLFSNVPNAATPLTDSLGLFAAARIEGVVQGGSEKRQSAMEAITPQGGTDPVGNGFDTKGDDLEALLLLPTDPKRSLEDTMKAFSSKGGYAAILGVAWQANGKPALDINGARAGGVEVVRYSGYEGGKLKLTARGGAGLRKLQGAGVSPDVAGRASFIVYYNADPLRFTSSAGWNAHNEELIYQVMVIPISIPARASSGLGGFEQPNQGSAFAQITNSGGESGLTEWFRYDEISSEGYFVRDDSVALLNANGGAHPGIDPGVPPPLPPGGGGGGGKGGGGGAFEILTEPLNHTFNGVALAPAALAPAPPQDQQGGNSYWFHAIGEKEDKDHVVSRAVNSQFQFRGVLGTYQHVQRAGVMILPVFRTRNTDEAQGWPGRFDDVMFLSQDPEEPGFPAVVQHAHRPSEYLAYSWQEGGDMQTPKAIAKPANLPQAGFQVALTHVALESQLAVPFAYTRMGSEDTPIDTRLLTRMTLFPSGELPRVITKAQLGGDLFGKGGVPSAVVDEALFFPNPFTNLSGMPGQLVLATELSEKKDTFTCAKDTLRTTLGDRVLKTNVLASLPQHGGLLRIGDEILCYDSYDTSTFVFTIPDGGRGLLGTDVQPHRMTEGIEYLGALPCGVLGATIGPDDGELTLLEIPAGFPAQGLVRIDDELVHFTRVSGTSLGMPRASRAAGAMDGKGAGLFRGRFGTQRAGHVTGTPVILYPFRYWDLWADLADAPEMTYYQLTGEQPDAFWRRVFWKTGDAGFPGPELGVLQRTNEATPWDAAPDVPDSAGGKSGLSLLLDGKLDGGGNPIGVQTDRVEWRVFVRHKPGSFDPLQGLAHGWKTTPRLELFGADYLGPGRTLARVDR